MDATAHNLLELISAFLPLALRGDTQAMFPSDSTDEAFAKSFLAWNPGERQESDATIQTILQERGSFPWFRDT